MPHVTHRFEQPVASLIANDVQAGGIPVLAHPGLANRDALIPGLVDAGLLGIETYYPEHAAWQTQGYQDMCRRHGLIATGGSDFHGPTVGHTPHPGAQAVPASAWEELHARAVALGAPGA